MLTKPCFPPETTCCFTGHRPMKLPWGTDENAPECKKLKKTISDIARSLYHRGVIHFICGMAPGCDMYFCEEILRLRDEYPDITIEAALPCETQADRWDEALRNRYFGLVAECDFETMVNRRYTPDCMLLRNKYMVDCSSVLIAVYDGKFGGTMQTINYAQKRGVRIIELQP